MTNCLHCGLKTATQAETFCCQGCKLAYQIINNLGLNQFYQKRTTNLEASAFKPVENINNQEVEMGEFMQAENPNHYSISLMIEGLHCAACFWLIETVLQKQTEVIKARINMSSHKLELQWLANQETYQAIGNNLIRLIFNLGYRPIPFDPVILKEQEQKYDNKILKALAVAGFAAGNVMLISVAIWSSSSLQMGVATRNLLYWLSALIALPAIIYSGQIFFISAFKSIKSGRMNMDVPIAVAIVLASLISVFEVIIKGEHAYFDSVIMLLFFLLIGRYLDFSSRKKAFSIATDLMMLASNSATVIIEGKNKIIASKNLQKDMILNIAMGEKIAADGLIIKGRAEIDTSIITGESLPQKLTVGDEVFAGMINLGNAIQVKITKTKEQTLLAKIVKMVEEIENAKTHYTKIADIVAKYYTPAIHLIAFAAFLLGLLLLKIGWHQALLNAAAVLIITCPCALALAVPVVQIVAAGKLLKQGILIKNGTCLEKLNKINTIIFDKTGTLTNEKPSLISYQINGEEEEIWQIAASMAMASKHILSKALLDNFKGEPLILEVEELPSMGLKASYQGKEVRLGKLEFVTEKNNQGLNNNISYKAENLPINKPEESQLYFSYNQEISVFNFQNQLKSDSKEVINYLQNSKKYQIILLSGDKKSAVEAAAKQLGIEEFYFEQTPDQKLKILQRLKSQNKNILMVGDGINDAPALMFADVSMSPSKAADLTKNVADIIFQGNKLNPVLQTIKIANNSQNIIKQNLAFALFYNLFAIPFAVFGLVLPLFAALAMSASSIIVVLNAMRINRGFKSNSLESF